MATIKYEFCDGTIAEIEVSDELYALHETLLQAEKRNHWKETRRHVSLNYLNELGVDFEDNSADIMDKLIRQEDEKNLHIALASLSINQRELIEKIIFDGLRPLDIAKSENVSKQAINNRLNKIYKKLRNIFEKGVD